MNIQEQVDLKPYNTFKVSVKAKYFIVVSTVKEFQQLLKHPIYKQENHLILGGGSNILLTKDFNGLVIKVDIRGIEIISQNDSSVTLWVGAGEVWNDLVSHCVGKDWGGIENLALIPGTVGAAPMQNIGAYGVEIKEVVEKVNAIDLATGEVRTFTNEDCRFGYRESVFKNDLKEKFFISSVTLRLSKKNHLIRTDYGAIKDTLKEMNITDVTIQSVRDAVTKIRQQKLPDPEVLGNSGSFFKNPTVPVEQYTSLKMKYPKIPGYSIENQLVKIPAAWLIESCGWKGKKINDAGVHHQQALVLVNHGDATGEEIQSLSEKIQADVYANFSITLSPEVNIL